MRRRGDVTPLSGTMLEALKYAVDLGWLVMPLHGVGGAGICTCGDVGCETPAKHPRIPNGLTGASVAVEEIGDWGDRWRDSNVGIVTGAVSNLVVLDIDGPEGAEALAALGPIPDTLAANTARGRHLLFAHPGYPVRNSAGKLGPKLDVRGDGGYVVAPPSLHRSGVRYTWASDPFTTELAPWPDVFRRALAAADARVPSPASTTAHAETMRTLVAAAKARGYSSDFIADSLDRRIRRYLDTVGHRGKGERNATAFRVARWLSNDFGASEAITWAYLCEWNQGNTPPLSSRELRLTLRSALRSGSRPAGCAHIPQVAVL